MSLDVAYLDSGVWIAYGLGKEDYFYESSKDLLENRLGRNNLIGIISILSILESIDAIRRRITEKTDVEYLNSVGDNVELRNEIIKSITEPKIRQLATYLTSMEREMKLIFADFQRVDINEIINNTYGFEKKYFGIIRRYNRCSRCRRRYLNYLYKGLGFIDVTHLNLAISLLCNRFITTDQYFNHVIDYSEYSSLEFEIFKPSYR